MLDLASIMTGVIITGILGSVVAATLVFVIPWFNDKVAQDDINLIKVAQESHYSDKGMYGDLPALDSNNYLHKTLSEEACVVPSAAPASDYTIYVKSKSGKIFSYKPADLKSTVVASIPSTTTCKRVP